MTTLEAHHDGKIPCGKCGQWVYERGGIDYDPLYDAWICVGCRGDEFATEALGVEEVAENLGFSILGTGGGCTAFSKTLSDGSVLLITGGDGSTIPEAAEEDCILGHYTDESLEAVVMGSHNQFHEHYKVLKGIYSCNVDECFEIAYSLWDEVESKAREE